ncbi:MAG TPA: phenol hydroxylase subunit P4 [Rhodocyclaceae bacterium]|jgi:phenol hydroxylase P4 protein
MAVAAIKPYSGEVKDRQENFHGAQLLYVGWDHHLMFCAPFCFPFPPSMRFGDVVEKAFPPAFGYHPDFAQINWATMEWLKSGKPWKPDFNKSLAENGLKHKDVLRFKTPGLNGIKGSGS